MSDDLYTIHTDLDPRYVEAIGLQIFAMWVEFATGKRALGGNRIMYPTGRYAASIQYRREGEATVAIVADTSIAPEAEWIEKGHRPVDLKTLLTPGVYPMHRAAGGGAGGLLRTGAGKPAKTKAGVRNMVGGGPAMWAETRSSESTGFASIGPNSPPGSWIIPAMRAYSPALILSKQAQNMASELARSG